MANYCDFDCRIISDNSQELEKRLLELIHEAEAKHIGLFIGERYLFDAYLEVEDEKITLRGYTKWNFDSNDMTKFVHFINSFNIEFSSVEVEYEESGCQLFGRYSYEDYVITHNFIGDVGYPISTEDCDIEYEQLCDALEEHGIEESWSIAL